ncbi:hypothetical protein ACJQWK_05748 [Exserohilum turcicum]|uniref:C3H1-type domain-containing protein n=1 Tax=Exserohilum turcicum (strain 28A) TaxID=671987 RepID=R0IVC0_EXST2|nr:uncharacterized protein SETTUDRAFT_38042 [Exserohilum turcica Et28A]EOA88715.1 hypothetical protein SETTUDRAFT_38042 [Exserohilum turcica Et28A]
MHPSLREPYPRYSPSQHAGQKRKLTDRTSDAQPPNKALQQSSKPPRAKAAVPPQVPSFGFSLPMPPVTKPDDKKRKVTLGLSHQVARDESSDEEVDEEATYSEKLKGGGFAFEHEGETITIQTGAEVAAWIKDRRKNFPTQKRIMEKQEEAVKKRKAELDFLRRMQGKPPKEEEPAGLSQSQPQKSSGERKHHGVKHETDKQKKQEELAALRQKLHESMVRKQPAAAVVDLGLGYDSETESDESSVLSESSVVSSSEASESESDSEESDEAPEVTSSKVAPPAVKVPPPQPASSRTESKSNRLCTNWRRNGRCPYYSKCKYQHPPKQEDNKLPGLYERMVEQELVRADQLALGAIKYLGQHGFLG